MANVFLALILVIRLWNVDPMEEVLEALMTKLGVGHVIILAILLLLSTLQDATIAVDLVINPKHVLVQEDNQ